MFKRSSDGRVFFQNDDDNDLQPGPLRGAANNGAGNGASGSYQPSAQPSGNQSQMQILALLKALNQKLGSTQKEREYLRSELETYKNLVQDLRRKTGAHEKSTAALEAQLKALQSCGTGALQDKKLAGAYDELNEARKVLVHLEERTEAAERDLKARMAAIQAKEKEIRDRQDALEALHKSQEHKIRARIDQHQKVARQNQDAKWKELVARMESREKSLDDRLKATEEKTEGFSGHIQQALDQTARLEKRLEKEVQERMRIIRKMERIEESVIHTNETLNARAMVLLTDQAAAQKSGSPYLNAKGEFVEDYDGLQQDQDARSADIHPGAAFFNERPFLSRAMAVSAIVIVSVLAGWGVSNLQQTPSGTADPVSQTARFASPPSSASANPAQSREIAAQVQARDEDMDSAALSEPSQQVGVLSSPVEERAAVQDTIDNFIAGTQNEFDDIGAAPLTEEQDILAVLENNPEQLAESLNAIEPGAAPTATPRDENAQSPQVIDITEPAETVEVAALTAQEPSAPRTAGRQPAQNQDSAIQPIEPRDVSFGPDPALPDAVRQIEEQAFAGIAEAQHDLAAIYIAGHGGVKQNYDRAAQWFEMAAGNGVANAAYNLGVLHHQGIGMDRDLERAIRWYKYAADQGHPEAQYNLGIAHIEGLGVPYDAAAARRYFENAARQDVIEAAYNLGLIYENGLLGQPQPDRALYWYKQASDAGSPEGKAALEQLADNLDIGVREIAQLVDALDVTVQSQAYEDGRDRVASSGMSAEEKTRIVIRDIQNNLTSLGLYPGPSDGVAGPVTRDAIRAYQKKEGLEPTGQPTESLLTHMQKQSQAMTGSP